VIQEANIKPEKSNSYGNAEDVRKSVLVRT
jgi:hypothetical protein